MTEIKSPGILLGSMLKCSAVTWDSYAASAVSHEMPGCYSVAQDHRARSERNYLKEASLLICLILDIYYF